MPYSVAEYYNGYSGAYDIAIEPNYQKYEFYKTNMRVYKAMAMVGLLVCIDLGQQV